MEEVILEMFHKKFPDASKTSGYFPEYDIQAGPYKIEVKRDMLAGQTQNVAIEVSYKGKPSGLLTTQATHWIILFCQRSYVVLKVKELQQIIKNPRFRKVRGGDCNMSELILLPLKDARMYHIGDVI